MLALTSNVQRTKHAHILFVDTRLVVLRECIALQGQCSIKQLNGCHSPRVHVLFRNCRWLNKPEGSMCAWKVSLLKRMASALAMNYKHCGGYNHQDYKGQKSCNVSSDVIGWLCMFSYSSSCKKKKKQKVVPVLLIFLSQYTIFVYFLQNPKTNLNLLFKAGPPLIWVFGHFSLFCTMV